MRQEHVYVGFMVLLFAVLTVLFTALPRSRFSELERRELATFPEVDAGRIADGSFMADVSRWFSDSEPYRDLFMQMHLTIKDKMALHRGGDSQVTFHASTAPAGGGGADGGTGSAGGGAEEISKIANNGIIVTGSGDHVRAMMAFGGSAAGGTGFAATMNKLQSAFGPGVQVYCMVIPTASEFYCPEKAKANNAPQLPTIKNIYSHLQGVKGIDVHTALAAHTAEDIYLRTDHHWAPLGAYYAARELARAAGVPFKDLREYDRHVIKGFVGTMYGYSKDIAVKNSPEDFVYYTPRGVEYTTTVTTFKLNEDFKVTGESGPYKGRFFQDLSHRPGGAYCTFMGGDAMIVKVVTGTKNGRRLAIIKDSFGNALPGYLFGSFEEVHVLDFRYFPRNLVKYVRDNRITDFVVANNIFAAYGDMASGNYRDMLTRPNGIVAPEKKEEESVDKEDKEEREESPEAEPAPAAEPAVAPAPEPAEPAAEPEGEE